MIAGDRMSEREKGRERAQFYLGSVWTRDVLSSSMFIDLARQDNQEEISFWQWPKSEEGIEQRK